MEKNRPSRRAAYKDLFEKLWDSTFLLDRDDFVIRDANIACERSTGLSVDDVIGKSILDWVHPEDEGVFKKSLRIARRRHYPHRFEVRWKSGEKVLHMEMQGCVLKVGENEDEEVMQIIAHDVTQLVEAKEREKRFLDELQEANKKLEALSIRDEMTGLCNYRYLKGEMAREHERGVRYGSSYSVIFCDVDHFKNFNDTHGHQAGDEVLKKVAKILIEQSRNTDLPARYGGEEFAVLCRGVDWQGATIFAERIRKAIEEASFPGEEKQPLGKLTISVGVAGYPVDGQDPTEVIEAADQALYASKSSGRNRVTSNHELQSLASTPTLKAS